MKAKFTTKKLEKTVLAIIKERPDVKYIPARQICSYATGECTDGSVGCVIGQALKKIGVSTKTLKSFDNSGDSTISVIFEKLKLKPSNMLVEIQKAQDKGFVGGV